MGLYHTVTLAYGFPIPTSTDFDAIDDALKDEPENVDSVGYTVVGDLDQLLLTTRHISVGENEVVALDVSLFARPETPAWNTALHNAAHRLGLTNLPEPTWLLIHNHR
ncbi:hypothetical protein ACWEG1_05780 [Streptomyces bauhiniae]